MAKQKIFIGIDPDVDKSGVAYRLGNTVSLQNLVFFDLQDYLIKLKTNFEDIHIEVHVECGFLNKSNWHSVKGGTSAVNAQIGQRTGANHQVAKLIVQMCEKLELPHKQIKPTRSKIDATFFEKITGIKAKTNQEQRDAYMLIHGLRQ